MDSMTERQVGNSPARYLAHEVETWLSGLSVAAQDALDFLQSLTVDDAKPDTLRVKAAGMLLGHFRAAASLVLDRAQKAEYDARYRAQGRDPTDPSGVGL
jgi:hypothetical protein